MKIEESILELFDEKKLSLALAESCTGGALAALLTSVPGASIYFKASIVAYSNEIKMKFLGVRKETLVRYGAVSKEVVEEMCNGVLEKTDADYAIAVSGIAGPGGGTKEKPIGTVWMAIKKKDSQIFFQLLHAEGDRKNIVSFTVNHSLKKLYELVKEDAL